MNQSFAEFEQVHPEIAKTMKLLGISYDCYLDILRQLCELPRISISDRTEPLDPAMIYCRKYATTLYQS